MKNVLIFLSGAAVGSVVTWKLIEKKYKEIADEEIESVVETFKSRQKELEENKKDDKSDKKSTKKTKKGSKKEEKVELKNYSNIIKSNDYDVELEESDEDSNATVDIEIGEDRIIPYVIRPEQFGEDENYGTKSLTYYSDGILTDETDDVVVDPESWIGPDALNHFGEYENDSVYIRDESNEIDYEILKTEKAFSETHKGTD